ncbi:TPA: hypothetical protein TUY17_001491 [Streptococcus equi subsp. zooepidemicus]|uniref:hypothetical protein n=1 Tax=Streptococcus equi TaxID=1336 RepID=UPI001E33A3C9|nr:hypothetical protein [Streptococcus equi]MCD3423381.1 hypothetical protein [Streptococcus equi subsp. zooepidemicus]HEL0026342.1 hypothetical protein [Streptococcus equi subsp. zooepidemicus]HEL0733911.1 hypothetical protein [Streptococcus equi subsp. zooepidemicus]HEL1058636.1 hypothetical protein [Streptococcus equi subsp. zooepidemicus]HEL1103158.1 hypothetical protein [Streptococcus equi subsp. zooepidemicus]
MKKSTKAFIALMILIGGLLMVFSLNGKITEEQQKRDLETSIAKLLVSDYEGVKTIKFQGWGHSRETGSWGTTVIINSENRMSLSFDRLSGLKEISGSSYHPDTFKLVEKSGIEELEPIMYRVRDIEKVSLKGIRIIHSAE